MSQSVLIDLERLKYPYTGLYNFAENLGRELILQKDEKTHLTYFLPKKYEGSFGPDVDYFIQNPVQKFIFPFTGKFKAWHSTYQGSAYYPRNRSVKIIQTVHDLNFLYEKSHRPDKIKAQLKKIQAGLDRADSITAISAFTLGEIENHLRLGNQERRVIYNGCQVKTFEGFDTPGYRPERPYLFSMGTVLPKKNFHVLPALLVGNDYELVLAGLNQHPYQEKIWEEAARFGVRDRVHILGPVNEENKYWYYKNCLAFVFPSLAEGFGLPVVESMYFGKPLFLSDKTSLPEIGGDLAYYFRDFDPEHMRAVFESGINVFDIQLGPKLLRARYEFFSWKNAASQYLPLYSL